MDAVLKKIPLETINRIHPKVAAIEQKLNISPPHLPGAALIPEEVVDLVNHLHPIAVVSEKGEIYCVGQIGLYRWMRGILDGKHQVQVIEIKRKITDELAEHLMLIERFLVPALAPVNSLQARLMYEAIAQPSTRWPHAYKSIAHFSMLAGVKPHKDDGASQ
ncbi:hypothetical protein [Pseudomonas pohangensis]|uniref:hypothetical protein n=1 Tax=Pseudomonas pohangensis TaxID=364197 RepID=UPI000B7C8213|nr:hypothetical protein [Pseudomonas pohangensis]